MKIDLPTGSAALALPGTPTRHRRWRLVILLLLVVFAITTAAVWRYHHRQGPWRQATRALEHLDLDAAAVFLDRHLQHHPEDSAAWFLSARTARRLGRYGEAERFLIRCQEVGGVTEATRLEWDLFRIQQGDLGDIHMRLRRTVPPDHPDAPLVLEALARGYLAAGRLRDVLEACELWRSREPDHPWPWLWQGGVFEQLGNSQEAMTSYRMALEKAPEDAEIRLALGNLLARARQPGSAIEHFEHILNRTPDHEEALLGLAGCYLDQGQPEQAIPLVERVLVLDPPPARSLQLRGKAALDLGDARSAESWLTRAVEQAPDNPEALHQLILSLRAQDKTTEADTLSVRLEALRQDTNQVDRLVREIARQPDNLALRHETGSICLRIGREEEGVRWLQSALRLPGDHRLIHAALADHFSRRGDERAAAHRRQAQTP